MAQEKTKHSLSVVIPVRNEEQNLEALYHRLCGVLGTSGHAFDVIFIDDASNDGSWEVLRKLRTDDSRLKIIRFEKHYGQTAALAVGFFYATGDVIATLDADLQNDPADIPLLLVNLDENCDLVVGWRKHRRDHFVLKVLPSMLANILIRLVTGVRIHDVGCTLKVFKKRVVENIVLFGGMHRFLPLLAYEKGYSVKEAPVAHHPRRFGKSKYGLERIVQVVHDVATWKLASWSLTRARQPQYVLKEVII